MPYIAAATSSSKVLLVAAIAFVTVSAHATGTGCPAKQDGKPLTTGYVLDGPVQDKAILEADSVGTKAGVDFASWQVGYIYDAGRKVNLDCRYDGVAEPVVVQIDTPVKACAYRKSKKQGVKLSCR